MISERTLRKWRAEALKLREEGPIEGTIDATLTYNSKLQLAKVILRMTQELLDQRLLGRGE